MVVLDGCKTKRGRLGLWVDTNYNLILALVDGRNAMKTRDRTHSVGRGSKIVVINGILLVWTLGTVGGLDGPD